MYKLGLIALGLVSVILAAPLDQTSPIAILNSSQDGPNPDGSYAWGFDTENGIRAQESGALVSSKDGDSMSAQGSYSYPGDNGEIIQVSYVADKDGFRPQGAHLPTSPPIPPEIMAALEYIAAHPEENDIDAPKQ